MHTKKGMRIYLFFFYRHENISIEKDSDKAKISALEAKIATLEAALESALNNK